MPTSIPLPLPETPPELPAAAATSMPSTDAGTRFEFRGYTWRSYLVHIGDFGSAFSGLLVVAGAILLVMLGVIHGISIVRVPRTLLPLVASGLFVLAVWLSFLFYPLWSELVTRFVHIPFLRRGQTATGGEHAIPVHLNLVPGLRGWFVSAFIYHDDLAILSLSATGVHLRGDATTLDIAWEDILTVQSMNRLSTRLTRRAPATLLVRGIGTIDAIRLEALDRSSRRGLRARNRELRERLAACLQVVRAGYPPDPALLALNDPWGDRSLDAYQPPPEAFDRDETGKGKGVGNGG